MTSGLNLIRTGPGDRRLAPLIAELDRFLHETDGDELHAKVSPFNRLEAETRVVLAEWNGEAVGCGALRVRDPVLGEIKRMYVRPEARGLGLGRSILSELERWASELGLERLLLETVLRLEPAVGLYQTAGYQRIPNFPPYEDIVESACFAKRLEGTLPPIEQTMDATR